MPFFFVLGNASATRKEVKIVDVRLLRLKQVLEIFPVARSTWLDWVAQGVAPSPVKLGRCTCWVYSELTDFIENRREKDAKK